MTKDRPRNRPGRDGKSGGFRGPGGGKSWTRGPAKHSGRDTREASGEVTGGGDDKPWQRNRAEDRPAGESARRYERKPGPGKPGRTFDKPRGDFRDRPRDGFRNKPEQRAEADADAPRHKPHQSGRHQEFRRNDGRPHSGQWERRDAAFEEDGEVWIWGVHAAGAVIGNPKRKISKALVSRNGAHRAGLDPEALPKYAELLDPKEIDQRLPPGSVHQGIAVRCKPLDGLDISEAVVRPEHPLVILDQVTDPQNVGAVFRSAAAFGIGGVVMQTRNAPALGGALAKAATGAIERVEEIRAVNLSRAIDALRDAGWRVIGLDGSAEQTLDQAFAGDEPLAIVLGAEGGGIRPGVAKACTGLARIPIGAAMESLNVSNAAAIAFYEAARRGGAAPPPAKPPARAAVEEDAEAEETD